MKALWLVLIPMLFPVTLAGCASGKGSGDYERTESRRVYEVKMGVVEAVRYVKLEGTESGIGAASGAAIGGIAGSGAGDRRGSAIGAVVGAVVGGIVGAAAEEATTKKPGIEITVRMDTGRVLAVVQEDSGEKFAVGDRVRMLESGGQARITH